MTEPTPLRRRWSDRLLGHSRDAAPARLIDRLGGPLDDLGELMLEHNNAGVLIVDRRGCIVRASAAMRAMCGHAPRARAGEPATHVFVAEERDTLWARLQPALLGPTPDTTILATVERDGMQAGLPVEIAVLALREADGAISGLILRVADITVQRGLESQLGQSQKLQAVGQLAAGIAHDFNNLLTAILGAADAIAARLAIDGDTREDADTIRASAERGGNLVQHLLAFGRQQSLQPRIICVDDAIRDLTGLLRRLLGSHIRLELCLESPDRFARVDPTQLDQVLINLAVNARDAMDGGGTLTLRSGHITLHRPLVRGPETIPPGNYVMIEVADTGVGIPRDVLPRIFDPFFSTKRERGGSGLGLSTVHGIIRQSDGFLGVESEPGQGTRLRVYLPRHDVSGGVAIPPPPAARAPAPAALRRVLLVEDESLVRRLAERAFVQAGWTVLSAESGEVALELAVACDSPLDLVISDVMMPGIDGPALVCRLRETWPELPAVLVSGYADEPLRSRLVKLGATFLPKPYSLAMLLERARSAAGPGTAALHP